MSNWLTIVLPMWILVLIAVLGQGLLMKRHMKKWDKPDPLPEVVAAGRQLYDDGEFKREIVKRTPSDLFGDTVQLSCGHESREMRDSTATTVNCHKCASEWIEKQSALETGRK